MEGGWESQAEEKEGVQDGALTQAGAGPSLLGSLNSHLAAPSTRVACFRPSSPQPCMPGEALSSLSALFSFQEGSGSSGPWVGHSLAWLTVPRFLVIPGGRAGISNQPWRGAESFSGTV